VAPRLEVIQPGDAWPAALHIPVRVNRAADASSVLTASITAALPKPIK
jgi:hypothetical protein